MLCYAMLCDDILYCNILYNTIIETGRSHLPCNNYRRLLILMYYYIYIYICIEREICIYIYIYIYTHIYAHTTCQLGVVSPRTPRQVHRHRSIPMIIILLLLLFLLLLLLLLLLLCTIIITITCIIIITILCTRYYYYDYYYYDYTDICCYCVPNLGRHLSSVPELGRRCRAREREVKPLRASQSFSRASRSFLERGFPWHWL